MFSHYSYLCHPDGGREPTGLLDLNSAGPCSRRSVVHGLVKNGELLAKVPFSSIQDMRSLRAALNAFYPRRSETDKRNNSPD